VEEMAAAIKKVMLDSELQEKMVAEGYRHARSFDADKVADNMMKVYQKLI
jgi:glycosyltransferase involved in cell wall biosynthesis